MMEEVFIIRIKTKPIISSLYPSERRYSASTVGGLAILHFGLGALALLLGSLAGLVQGPILALACLVPFISGLLAWKKWYIDRNIGFFFYGSLVSFIVAFLCVAVTIFDMTNILQGKASSSWSLEHIFGCNLPVSANQSLPELDHFSTYNTSSDKSFLNRTVDNSVNDKTFSDQSVSDKTLVDEFVSDKTLVDEFVSDKTLGDESVSDRTLSDQSINNKTLDQSINDKTFYQSVNVKNFHQPVNDETASDLSDIIFGDKSLNDTQTIISDDQGFNLPFRRIDSLDDLVAESSMVQEKRTDRDDDESSSKNGSPEMMKVWEDEDGLLHSKLLMATNVLVASLLELSWSILSVRIGLRGMINRVETSYGGNATSGSKKQKFSRNKKSQAPRPDILSHYQKHFGSLVSLNSFQSSLNSGPRLPLPESSREFRERVERFLANQAAQRTVENSA